MPNQHKTMTLETIATIETAISNFRSIPCYPLLLSVSQGLTTDLFVDSPKNTNPLRGSFELFKTSQYATDLVALLATIPEAIAEPSRVIKTDYTVTKDYYKALEAYGEALDLFAETGSVFNKTLDNLKSLIASESILTRYKNYLRVVSFLDNKISDDFIPDDSLDIWEFSQDIRDRILSVYEDSFKANPIINYTGGSYRFDLSDVDGKPSQFTLLTVDGIDKIAEVKATINGGEMVFLSQDTCIKALKSCKSQLNAGSIMALIVRLNSNAGSKQNAGSTLKNLKLLITGIAPKKSKA